MRHFAKHTVGFLLITLSLVWLNCSSDKNPVVDLSDPSTFPGNYKLISITDKDGDFFELGIGFTLNANQPTSVQSEVNGVTITSTITLTGTLTLTDTRYTISTNIVAVTPGFPDVNESDTDTGTYMISGSSITIDSDDPNEITESGSISANGSRITIETSDTRLVYEKQ